MDIQEQDEDGVLIEGLSDDETLEAAALFRAAQRRGEEVDHIRGRLIELLQLSSGATVPDPTLEQAKRNARLRQELLSQPHYDYQALAEMRGTQIDSVRTWATRLRQKNQLFSVKSGGHVIFAAFQFDDDGQPRRELKPVIEALHRRGFGGWQIWAWFTAPNSWLDDASPIELLDRQAARVVAAAERRGMVAQEPLRA